MSAPLGLTRLGSGPALVLLHSLGAHRGVWRPVMGLLAQQREVLAFDLPGFGDSAPLTDEVPTPDRLGAAIAAELERLGVDEYAVAGNSLGGWVALELGLTGGPRNVTAIAPAGLWRGPLEPKPGYGQLTARAIYPLLGPLIRIGPLRRAALSLQVAHPERVPRDQALELLRQFARAKGLKAANDAMRAGRFAAIDQIEVPLTLVWPGRDRLVGRPRQLPATARNITLPDAGHLPMWDDPAGVANALIEGSAA